MDVTCKCGHSVKMHMSDSGCCHTSGMSSSLCMCTINQNQVYEIYITEQQARLDTNRQQNAVMAKKIKKQNNKIDFMFSQLFRISSGHGLYDENDMIKIARETLDRVGRNV